MKNIHLLDCTLRDGGRIIDCKFLNNDIQDIITRLTEAKIDIIEVGFLRDRRKIQYSGNSTFFTSVEQITPFLKNKNSHSLYVAFVDYKMFDIDSLSSYDGNSIDGIRFGFTKKDFIQNKENIKLWMKIIKQRGYKLFIQGVNSLNYSDKEFLEILQMVNETRPYSFGIVDTYGAMYADDLQHLYDLVNRNINEDICINFHSHNNYQLSFSLAQEIISLSNLNNRQIIIDATLGGMGKVAGNLNLELIADYLVRKKQYDYDLDTLLDIFDDYIFKYSLKHKWGYSIPALMSGIYKSHPNNVIYLTEKFRLDSKDIGKLLSMIVPMDRQTYNYDNIEKLYIEYISDKIDDSKSLEQLKKLISDREVLVLVPGSTLNTYQDKINSYIQQHDVFIISVNFISQYLKAYAFYGNQKRYNKIAEEGIATNLIITSNIKTKIKTITINYHSVINRGYKYFENTTMMLLNLLKRLGVKNISIAGFDGFDNAKTNNYRDDSFQNERHISQFEDLNEEIGKMYQDFVKTIEHKCTIKFLTPSQFEKHKNKNGF